MHWEPATVICSATEGDELGACVRGAHSHVHRPVPMRRRDRQRVSELCRCHCAQELHELGAFALLPQLGFARSGRPGEQAAVCAITLASAIAAVVFPAPPFPSTVTSFP